jgi:hypothetical protein
MNFNEKMCTNTQLKFLRWCLDHHTDDMMFIERARISNTIACGKYRVEGKRPGTFNKLRELYIDEYLKSKK